MQASTSTPSRHPHIFQTLISAFRTDDSQVLKLPQMKRLYLQLNYLSLKTPMCFSENGASLNCLDMEFDQEGFKVIYTDLYMISDILFRELDKKFECYFSVTRADEEAALHFDNSTDMEELSLLLRCCMVILTLSASDQIALMKKCRVLLSVLSRIFSLCVNEGNKMDSISFKMESASPYLCTLLEVFADELLIHKSLREYLLLVDSTSSSSEMLFASHLGPGDIGSVLEVICCRFILSIPDEQAFEGFLERLCCKHRNMGYKIPELSLAAALSLLHHPILLSAPVMFQVHLILLVSESMSGGMSSESYRPVPSLMGMYLTAFEKSVILYYRLFPRPRNDNPANCFFAKSSTLGRSSRPSLEHYVKEDTRDKIDQVGTKFNDLLESALCNKLFRTKSELVASSIAYVEENQHVLDEVCRDKILSIVGCILNRASDDGANNAEVCGELDIIPQETCLLAAVLKLMSGSLLQAVLCSRKKETLKDSSLCGEYDFVMKITGCFQDSKACLPILKFFGDVIKDERMKHKEFKWILFHFSGLLSQSLVCGIDFMVKKCIFTIMTLLNVLQEDDLAMLVLLLGCEAESCLHNDVHEAKSSSKASQKVASNFQRIRRVQLSTESQSERVCDGTDYLKCVAGSTVDIDDLADFVECKKGRDYSGWLKVRQTYRARKESKRAGCRFKRMKRKGKENEFAVHLSL